LIWKASGVLYVHLTFAGVALTATVPRHIRSQDWGFFLVLVLILANLAAAYFSQRHLNDETATAMKADESRKVRLMGIMIGVVYLFSAAFVIYGVQGKPPS
jgi:hypothetical protein